MSSLVYDFRRIAGDVATILGELVIAIDELDKIADTTRVAALLRDIKGILDVPHVQFLVSVSYEALRALSLGAEEGRNEFNSSFYAVVEFPPMAPDKCEQILIKRTSRDDYMVWRALGVMSCGIPRELVRLAEIVENAHAEDVASALVTVVTVESTAMIREIVEARVKRHTGTSDSLMEFVYRALYGGTFAADSLGLFSLTHIDSLWGLDWGSQASASEFEEPWRRLLVRIGLGALMASDPKLISRDDRASSLQEVAVWASRSATIARAMLSDPSLSAPQPRAP